ncbi:MAG: N-6 DNA methylase [Tissierellia bacterium]|nr:N-6 DNA methylase [Tissierellia bacterium]
MNHREYLELKKLDISSIRDDILKEVKRDFYEDFYYYSMVLAAAIYVMKKNQIRNLDKLYSCIMDLEIEKTAKNEILRIIENVNNEIITFSDKYCLEEIQAYILLSKDIIFSKVNENKTPLPIVKLVHRLLNPLSGETIMDLCSGIGDFLIYSQIINPNTNCKGVEISSKNIVINSVRAYVSDVKVNLYNNDIFSDEALKLKADKVFSNYPFGEKYLDLLAKLRKKDNFWYLGLLKKSISPEWVYNRIVAESIKENGKAVVIMSNSGLWNDSDEITRQYFLENGLIESVIALPDNLFSNTHIDSSILVISHNNSKINFVDATEIFTPGRRKNTITDEQIEEIIFHLDGDTHLSKIVNYSDIKKPYNLYPKSYIKAQQKFEEMVCLKEYLLDVKRGPSIPSIELDEMVSEEDTDTKYLLTNNIIDGEIDNKMISLNKLSSSYRKFYLNPLEIVLSKNGTPFKSAVCDINGNINIIPNGNLYIIKVDESKANPYFIKAFFECEQGQKILNSFAKGSKIKNISIKDLLNVLVPKVDKEIQDAFSSEYISRKNKIIKKKRDLEREIQVKKLLLRKYIL